MPQQSQRPQKPQGGAPSDPSAFRRIKSFVKREGRLTPGQQRAMDELWPRYGIEYRHEALDFESVFQEKAPVVLDIGFGNGESLIAMAQELPNYDFLGVEVHRPGVGGCLLRVEEHKLGNVRVLCHDAFEVLEHMIPAQSLKRICIFYPDPWHKKRHHKRRLIKQSLLDLAHGALIAEGELHIVTDWEDYAEHIIENVTNHGGWTFDGNSPKIDRPDYRPVTKYERRGLKLGHQIFELRYKKA